MSTLSTSRSLGAIRRYDGEAQEPGERRVVQASEILEKIQKEVPVEYHDVIIEGDLDLTMLDLPEQRVERTGIEINVLGLAEIAKIVASRIQITYVFSWLGLTSASGSC